MKRRLSAGRLLTIALAVASLLAVVYIVWHHMGVVDGYDFGAGAYYYADIPDFEKHVPQSDTPNPTDIPSWIYYLLFLAWGALMWFLWKAVDHFGRK
ncbi:MAG: hypothetical protein J5771_00910 [Bacteroidales bacterium]|nr:hypothetical protein [Bacteroidales bacterium]